MAFYLLGLSNSGLAVPASKGESNIYVRSTTGMSVGDMIEIGTGSTVETRKIASITAPAPVPEENPAQFRFGRRGAPGGATTIWQPLPEGPIITIPAGSTNIPVTDISEFAVGQKMAIGYGATYPSVSQTIEKYEVVTITEVGKQGTQAWLSVDAKAGDTNIKVSSVENISVGDKIVLDIDSKDHGIETVTVTRVGTQSSRSSSRGPLTASEDAGTGLDLAEPLKFNHSSNIPFSVRGTGISFEPATAFAHSSNEPVLPLIHSIALDQPLANSHDIDAVVRDAKVTTEGYQWKQKPDQWFGGPALSSSAGNMVLRDANGNIVDGLNYGGLVDPYAAEGYQAASGAGASGCSVTSPGGFSRGFRFSSAPVSQPNRSAGRFPDGVDNDSNCQDFKLQNTFNLAATSLAGSNNIKVNSVSGLNNGQEIIIGAERNSETAVIATIGTTGGTTTASATKAKATVILVPSVEGFSAGQTITIDSGNKKETAVVASVAATRRRFGRGNTNAQTDTINVTMPLKLAHVSEVQVSGSGITLASPLKMAHENGTPVTSSIPTPGEPNKY